MQTVPGASDGPTHAPPPMPAWCGHQVDVFDVAYSRMCDKIAASTDFETVRRAHAEFLSNVTVHSYLRDRVRRAARGARLLPLPLTAASLSDGCGWAPDAPRVNHEDAAACHGLHGAGGSRVVGSQGEDPAGGAAASQPRQGERWASVPDCGCKGADSRGAGVRVLTVAVCVGWPHQEFRSNINYLFTLLRPRTGERRSSLMLRMDFNGYFVSLVSASAPRGAAPRASRPASAGSKHGGGRAAAGAGAARDRGAGGRASAAAPRAPSVSSASGGGAAGSQQRDAGRHRRAGSHGVPRVPSSRSMGAASTASIGDADLGIVPLRAPAAGSRTATSRSSVAGAGAAVDISQHLGTMEIGAGGRDQRTYAGTSSGSRGAAGTRPGLSQLRAGSAASRADAASDDAPRPAVATTRSLSYADVFSP